MGVGVEPVCKHVDMLRCCLLPNTALVRAAIGKLNEQVMVYAIDEEQHQKALDELEVSKRKKCKDQIEFLRNMSCVGQAHPQYECQRKYIENEFGVNVVLRPLQATSLSYEALSNLLEFLAQMS